MSDLYSRNIQTHADFVAFLEDLDVDFSVNGDNWENNTLDLYLSTLAAYAKDIDGVYANNYPDVDFKVPTWQIFADILRGVRYYE